MEVASVVVGLVIGLVAGAAIALAALTGRMQGLRAQAETAARERDEARAQAQAAGAERERASVELASVRASLEGVQARQRSLEEERDQAVERERQARAQAEASAAQAAGATVRASKAEEEAERLREELQGLRSEFLALQSSHKTLEASMAERERSLREQIAEFDKIRERWTQEFGNLAQEALGKNAELFLKLANENLQKPVQQVSELVKPVRESLEKLERQNQDLENRRTEAQAKLQEQLEALTRQSQQLQKEAHGLVQALRAPQQRGRWGEMQLRRVVEMAGMVAYCDFEEQVTDDRSRPDMVVRMPNGRTVVVDSKVSLTAYWDAQDAEDEDERKQKLKAHARHVRDKIVELSDRRYWEQFRSVDFVVLFLPNEPMLGAALEHDAGLVELGVDRKVLLATPMTLLSLLRAVAFGWQQQQLTENAAKISQAGKELYERVAKMGQHLERLGKSLKGAVESYNDTVGSLESRVLPQARKIRELRGDQKDPIPSLEPLESQPRRTTAPELAGPDQQSALFSGDVGEETP